MLSQKTRIWTMIGLISLSLMVVGYILGERQGLLVGFMLALGINYLVFHYSTSHWLDYFKAAQIEGQDPWNLLLLTRNTAAKAQIPSPRVYLISSSFPTAFSVGRSVRNSSIVVSHGLLKCLSPDELEAVIAYEIFNIKRLEMFNIGVVSGLSAPLFVFCKMVDQTLTLLTLGALKKKHLTLHLCERLMEIIARPIISHKNCFETDYQASLILKSPEQLARALWKLKNYATTRKLDIPSNAAPLLMVNPLTNGHQTRYLHVQPSVTARIERLIGRFPL